jgi:hypothetical protein
MGEYHLAQEIIKRSVAKNWNDAKREWALETVYFATEPDRCLCGKFPITELCVLRNRKNDREAVVGNECVKKFLGLPSDRIFNGLRRIQVDAEKALNEDAIRYAHSRGWINDWGARLLPRYMEEAKALIRSGCDSRADQRKSHADGEARRATCTDHALTRASGSQIERPRSLRVTARQRRPPRPTMTIPQPALRRCNVGSASRPWRPGREGRPPFQESTILGSARLRSSDACATTRISVL